MPTQILPSHAYPLRLADGWRRDLDAWLDVAARSSRGRRVDASALVADGLCTVGDVTVRVERIRWMEVVTAGVEALRRLDAGASKVVVDLDDRGTSLLVEPAEPGSRCVASLVEFGLPLVLLAEESTFDLQSLADGLDELLEEATGHAGESKPTAARDALLTRLRRLRSGLRRRRPRGRPTTGQSAFPEWLEVASNEAGLSMTSVLELRGSPLERHDGAVCFDRHALAVRGAQLDPAARVAFPLLALESALLKPAAPSAPDSLPQQRALLARHALDLDGAFAEHRLPFRSDAAWQRIVAEARASVASQPLTVASVAEPIARGPAGPLLEPPDEASPDRRFLRYRQHWSATLGPLSRRDAVSLRGLPGALCVLSSRLIEVHAPQDGSLLWRRRIDRAERVAQAERSLRVVGPRRLETWSAAPDIRGGTVDAPWEAPLSVVATAAGTLHVADQAGVAWVMGADGRCEAMRASEGARTVGVRAANDAVLLEFGSGEARAVWPDGWQHALRSRGVRVSFVASSAAWWAVSHDRGLLEVVAVLADRQRSCAWTVEGTPVEVAPRPDGGLDLIADHGGVLAWHVLYAADDGRVRVASTLRLDASDEAAWCLVAGRLVVTGRSEVVLLRSVAGEVSRGWNHGPLELEPDARLATNGRDVVLADSRVLVWAADSGRLLSEHAAPWEQVESLTMLDDASLVAVESPGQGGRVLHGLPSPGWLAEVPRPGQMPR